jgi:hypothetical protein
VGNVTLALLPQAGMDPGSVTAYACSITALAGALVPPACFACGAGFYGCAAAGAVAEAAAETASHGAYVPACPPAGRQLQASGAAYETTLVGVQPELAALEFLPAALPADAIANLQAAGFPVDSSGQYVPPYPSAPAVAKASGQSGVLIIAVAAVAAIALAGTATTVYMFRRSRRDKACIVAGNAGPRLSRSV